jgi:ABC-2 type transport system ATP-binding protein
VTVTAERSSEIVLRTVALTKRYGKRTAVDALDIEVRRGSVFGFLGPNGSGKTTTIGTMLGLVAPTRGNTELFGLDTRTHLTKALARTGATIEGQAYFPHMSARDNLRFWAKVDPRITNTRIDEVLSMVGLTTRSRDKVRTYSLGMRQRLAVATAILHDPELVILDEPTNGLDPAGIREFRSLVRQFAEEGKTVFVSSHILNEVEQMCDEVAILKSGQLLTQGPVATLVAPSGVLELRTTDVAGAEAAIRALGWPGAITREADGRLAVEAAPERAAEISRALAERQIWLTELRTRENSLEDFFLEVTEGGDAGA